MTLIAVDGLTYELARERPSRSLRHLTPIDPMPGSSATERWASVGTGVPTGIHGVRAVDGVRFRSGRHLLQSVSPADFVLRDLAEDREAGARASRCRRRCANAITSGRFSRARLLPSLSVNWWTTDDSQSGALDEISQKPLFAAARARRLRRPRPKRANRRGRVGASVCSAATRICRFGTVYLPALDIILNRLTLDPATRLAASVRVLDNLDRVDRQRRAATSSS